MNNNNIIRLVVLVVIIAAGAYFFYGKSGTPTSGKVLERIEQKVMVPPNQEPRIVVLTSVDTIKQQPFFNKAEVGDAVAVYTDTVILYRPATDKIISMGAIDPTISAQLFSTPDAPIVVDPAAPAAPGTVPATPGADTTTAPAAPAAPVSLEIRNGTTKQGLAKTFADMFTGNTAVAGITTGNASNNAYTTTVVVNLSGQPIPDIESVFGVTAVTELPAGEPASTSQVLVILGADKV